MPRQRETGPHASRPKGRGGEEKEPAPWPVMAEEAYHGLAGKMVSTIAPQSESDPVALLVQFLAAAGNIVGRAYYYQVEATRHHANLYGIVVGDSSVARKGTSCGALPYELWVSDRVKGGLSSGEGFISEVRDQVQKWDASANTLNVIDPGVTDKRLTITEHEFAGALAVMERHGNTLSTMIRRAWDGDKLATLDKNLLALRDRRAYQHPRSYHRDGVTGAPHPHRRRQRFRQSVSLHPGEAVQASPLRRQAC